LLWACSFIAVIHADKLVPWDLLPDLQQRDQRKNRKKDPSQWIKPPK
jgi:hypothetical protein